MGAHVNPGGFRAATTYIIVVVFLFVVTFFNTKPSNVGLDGIPLLLLSMPWVGFDRHLLFPGLILNAGVMYLLGMLLHRIWLRITKH